MTHEQIATIFQTISPYAIYKRHVLIGIKDNAPSDVKEAYDRLQKSSVVLSESGAKVRVERFGGF